MAQFVVLEAVEPLPEKAQNGSSSLKAAKQDAVADERIVFVRDGFSLFGFIVPFVWLLMQRLWFEAFAVLGVTILLGLAGSYFGITDIIPLLTLLVSCFVALEGAGWKIAKLQRQGFIERTAIDAKSLNEAEIRYFYSRNVSSDSQAVPDATEPQPDFNSSAPSPAYSVSLGSTIGFVGHRGEN